MRTVVALWIPAAQTLVAMVVLAPTYPTAISAPVRTCTVARAVNTMLATLAQTTPASMEALASKLAQATSRACAWQVLVESDARPRLMIPVFLGHVSTEVVVSQVVTLHTLVDALLIILAETVTHSSPLTHVSRVKYYSYIIHPLQHIDILFNGINTHMCTHAHIGHTEAASDGKETDLVVGLLLGVFILLIVLGIIILVVVIAVIKFRKYKLDKQASGQLQKPYHMQEAQLYCYHVHVCVHTLYLQQW